jgi:hypothetical protein
MINSIQEGQTLRQGRALCLALLNQVFSPVRECLPEPDSPEAGTDMRRHFPGECLMPHIQIIIEKG